MAADLTTVVLELKAKVDEAEATFQTFASDMEGIFGGVESAVNDNFDNIQKKATETADHFQKEGKRAGDGFRQGVEVALGSIGVAFVLSMRKVYEEGMQLTEQFKVLSAITGNTPGQLMQFRYALGQLGIPAQNLQLILAQLRTRITEAGMASNQNKGPLHELGLSIKNLANKDAISQLEVIADKIKNLRPDQQSRAVQQLFGFRGAAMLPLLEQGAAGVKKLVESFKPPDPAVWEAFDKLASEMSKVRDTWLAFGMELLAPVLNGFSTLIEKATEFINVLRHISEETKLSALVIAVGLAAVGFETLTTLIGSFLVQGEAVRSFIVILQSFARPLEILVGLVIIIAAAWKSNWGDIRELVTGVLLDIQGHAKDFEAVWQATVAYFQAEVVPAFEELSEAVSQLIRPLFDTATGILGNKSAWYDLIGVIHTAISILADIVHALTWVADNFGLLATAIITAIVIRAVPAVLAALTSIAEGFAGALISAWTFANGTALAMAEASLAGEGFGGVIRALGVAFLGLAGAEDLAFPPMLIFQAIIAVIGGIIAILVTNVGGLRDKLADLAGALAWASEKVDDLEHSFRTLNNTITTVYPPLGAIESVVHGIGVAAKWASDRLHEMSAANNDWSGSVGHYGGPTAPKKKPHEGGSAVLAPDEAKGKDTTPAWLDALKDKLAQLDGPIEKAQFYFDSLAAHIKLLGDIDSPRKLAEAESYIAQEGKKANDVIAAQVVKLHAIIAAEAELRKKLSTTTNPKDHHTLQDALNSLIKDQYKTELDITNEKVKQVELDKEAYEIRKKYNDAISEDKTRPWSGSVSVSGGSSESALKSLGTAITTRLGAAIQQFWGDIKAGIKVGWEEKAKDLEVVIATFNGMDESAKKLADSFITITSAQSKYFAELAKAPGGGGTGGTNAVEAAQLDVTAAQQKLAAATQDLANQQYELQRVIPMLTAEYGKAYTSSEVYTTLQTQINTATATEISEKTNLIAAEQQLYQATNAVSIALYSKLDELAKQIGGPVYSAFVALASYIQGNMVNSITSLESAFQAIFEKTLAYKDIEVAIMEVTQTLALLLNDLRPIIDFLIGVLFGVINVFISMYDVLVMILDAFGLMIQKIKLLNSDLQNMNVAAQPLIEIVHDLPTLPQFNAGYWTQLIGEQTDANNNLNNLNSDILQGFDKTASKLGEIVGILLAIRVLLGISSGQMLSSIFGSLSSFFGKIMGSGGTSSAFNASASNAATAAMHAMSTSINTGFVPGINMFGASTAVDQDATGIYSIGTKLYQVVTTGAVVPAAATQQTAAGTMALAIGQFVGAVQEFTLAVTEMAATQTASSFASTIGDILATGAEFLGKRIGGGGGPGGSGPGGPFGPGGSSSPSEQQQAMYNALTEWSTFSAALLRPSLAPMGAGGSGGGGNGNPMTAMTVEFNGDNYGLDGDYVYNALKPVFDRLLAEYQQQQVLYTRSNNYAFSRGLSS